MANTTQYQTGGSVGAVVGVEAGGSPKDVLGPNTPAGQAFWVMVIGIVILFLFVARSGGLVRRVGEIAGFVLVVKAADVVGNYAARMYAANHPDGPLADGIRFDL